MAVALSVGSPYFHVGVVTDGGKLLHYIEPHLDWFYKPEGGLCGGGGPRFSDIRALLESHARHTNGAVLTVLRPPANVSQDRLLAAAHTTVRCGKHVRVYEKDYLRSYVMGRFLPIGDSLHCNTFVGLVYEALGLLPTSIHPREDYRPGSLLSVLSNRGRFINVSTTQTSGA